MDINIKVIEGVKQLPCLHGNSSNLVERNQAWMELSDKLKMPEEFLKIRWHLLLREYQLDSNFKYSNNMRFVSRKRERKIKEENWPEFIINEEYLKDVYSDQQEEYVIFETDEDNKCFKRESHNGKERNCNEESKQKQDISNKEFENNENCSEGQNEIPDTENCNKQQDEQCEDNVEISVVETSNVEEKKPAVHVDKNNESCIEVVKEVVNEKPQPLITERCEDVIFGELVSAMLKRMEEDKKKNIKREIMNILFS